MRRPWRTPARATIGVLLLCALVVSALPATADARPPGRGQERLAQNWHDMNPKQRQRALDNLERYKSLPESGRQRMDRSYESWQKLDPNERQRVQRNYEKYRDMSPDQRREFESKYKRWKGGKDE